MTSLIRTEMLKLRTARSTWGLLLAGFVLAALLGAATTATAGQDGAAGLGSADNLANILGVSALPGVLMLVLGILAMAGEYQHRTITQTFLVTPVRGRVVAAKLAATAVVGVPVAAVVMAAALGTALPRMWADGVTVDLVNRTVAETVAGNLLAGALLGVLGVSVGALLRSQLAAVLVVVTWGLVGEGILSVVVGQGFVRWLPGGAAQAVISGGDDLLPLWAAALLLAAYSATGALAASRLTVRGDIA